MMSKNALSWYPSLNSWTFSSVNTFAGKINQNWKTQTQNKLIQNIYFELNEKTIKRIQIQKRFFEYTNSFILVKENVKVLEKVRTWK